MKKMYFLIVSLFVVFVITGCGKNDTKVLTCSGVSPGNNMNAASNVEYTFENSKMHRLEADCAENNLASAKVLLEKLKMNFEGKIKNYCKSYDGNIIGFNFYAITRDEYEAKK